MKYIISRTVDKVAADSVAGCGKVLVKHVRQHTAHHEIGISTLNPLHEQLGEAISAILKDA